MTLRIGFAGASGTGKTWLARKLAAEHGLPLCPVGSRQVAEQMGFANPYDVDRVPGARAAFQARLLTSKVEWERAHHSGGFVTDRTPADNLTYAALHCVGAIDYVMLHLTRAHFQTYTHVIVCRWDAFHQLGDDPARVLDPTYHRIYESCLLGLIADLRGGDGPRITHLEQSDSELRLQGVRHFITR